LAGFALLTVLLGLYLSHRIATIYTESVSVNQQWAERLGRYDELRRFAAAVNAPGNNVFDSRDVATESDATRNARRAFDEQLSQAQQDLAQRTAPAVAAILQDDLAAVQDAMNAMTAEARLIFSYFENDEPARAGERMATMDRTYDLVNVAFGQLNQHVRDIQASHFRAQIDAARSAHRFEWLIGVFVLLMIAGATAYGRRLSRRTETERQATEARFANILNIAADAIIAMDEDQRIVLFNQGAEQIFGYRAEDVMGKPLGLLLPPGAADAHHERVRAFAQGVDHSRRMSERGEVSGRRKDGTEFPAEASISKVTQNGHTIFTAILRDITERKKAEAVLQNIAEGVSAVTGVAFFRSLVEHLARALDVEYAFVGEVVGTNRERVRTAAVCARGAIVDNFEYDLAGTPCQQVVGHKLCAYTSGVQQQFPDDRLLVEMGIESYLGMPLTDSAGQPLGLVAVMDGRPQGNPHLAESMLRIFATRASAELERRRVEDELATALRERENLMETIPDIIYMLDLDGRMVSWNKKAERITGFSAQELRDRPLADLFPESDRPPILESIRKAIESGGAEVEGHLLRKDGTTISYHWRKATLKDSQGRVIGLAGIGRDITERKQAEETIQSLAYYDPLTTLPNRVLLHDRLTRAIQTGQHQHKPVAFLLMDLDRFKDINNTLGHHHGDLLLQQMGPRLQGLLRQFDMVARLGGDEFAILLPGTDAEGAVLVVNKLQHALAAPFVIDGLTITVEASIGIAVSPDHGETADLLIQRANVAMYHAKQTGGGHTVYSPEHDHYNPRRLALMTELRYAIEHDELVLYYQPKIDLKTGRVIGVEALVRWRHPNRGLIAPDEFIPLAERTGLIKPLTLWVLTAALHQSRTWQRAGLRLSVAVNLSARNLQDPELPDQIAEMLTRSGTPPNQLELEITESTIMADPPRALEVLTRLHHMRIPLAIDDFGTGYSSLGYLRKLPVSAIKIDKSFVKNMVADDGDAVIVRSTIELAHNLGLLVVAEGVETQYIWDRLASLGCDAAQGYYMSAPIPAAALSRWFHESSWQVTKIADEAHPEAA
jgi:diguanylate cyclase (GGDEF)-like protein/PAS domain S-box-containing protein